MYDSRSMPQNPRQTAPEYPQEMTLWDDTNGLDYSSNYQMWDDSPEEQEVDQALNAPNDEDITLLQKIIWGLQMTTTFSGVMFTTFAVIAWPQNLALGACAIGLLLIVIIFAGVTAKTNIKRLKYLTLFCLAIGAAFLGAKDVIGLIFQANANGSLGLIIGCVVVLVVIVMGSKLTQRRARHYVR